MKIRINGEETTLPGGLSIAELLETLEMRPRFVAIECNRELIPRARHAEIILNEGDELEIVTLTGGG